MVTDLLGLVGAALCDMRSDRCKDRPTAGCRVALSSLDRQDGRNGAYDFLQVWTWLLLCLTSGYDSCCRPH